MTEDFKLRPDQVGDLALMIKNQVTSVALLQPSETFGALFDASPIDMVPDQFLLWVVLLAPLTLFGAGPLSIDTTSHKISAWRRRRQSTL